MLIIKNLNNSFIIKLNMDNIFYYFLPCCKCTFYRRKKKFIQKPYIKLDTFITDWSFLKQTPVYYFRTKINLQERYSCFTVYHCYNYSTIQKTYDISRLLCFKSSLIFEWMKQNQRA